MHLHCSEMHTVSHHHSQELYDDLAAWPDQHLALPTLLSTGNVSKSIRQHIHTHHLD